MFWEEISTWITALHSNEPDSQIQYCNVTPHNNLLYLRGCSQSQYCMGAVLFQISWYQIWCCSLLSTVDSLCTLNSTKWSLYCTVLTKSERKNLAQLTHIVTFLHTLIIFWFGHNLLIAVYTSQSFSDFHWHKTWFPLYYYLSYLIWCRNNLTQLT